MYELCVGRHYGIKPISYLQLGKYVEGNKGCYRGPRHYRAGGYLEGLNFFITGLWGGKELVYDFSTFERVTFTYSGLGLNDSIGGAGGSVYAGVAEGLRSDLPLRNAYRGLARMYGFGVTIGELIQPVGAGVGMAETTSWTDPKVKTLTWYTGLSGSKDLIPFFIEVSGSLTLWYSPLVDNAKEYKRPDGSVAIGELMSDIMSGSGSPVHNLLPNEIDYTLSLLSRALGMQEALRHYLIYEDTR